MNPWVLVAAGLLGAYGAAGIAFWAWDMYRMAVGSNMQARIDAADDNVKVLWQQHPAIAFVLFATVGFFEFLALWPFVLWARFPRKS